MRISPSPPLKALGDTLTSVSEPFATSSLQSLSLHVARPETAYSAMYRLVAMVAWWRARSRV